MVTVGGGVLKRLPIRPENSLKVITPEIKEWL